ncbi:MAG: DUF4339 domain-containing protein [Fusobacteriales bacterium]|jgi:hypothetical protein|nr:DUF4339 domain-containing protein [Fusobacteriales bacterium]
MIGPLDENIMMAAVANGSVLPSTLVFRIGEPDWKRADQYTKLFTKTGFRI